MKSEVMSVGFIYTHGVLALDMYELHKFIFFSICITTWRFQ